MSKVSQINQKLMWSALGRKGVHSSSDTFPSILGSNIFVCTKYGDFLFSGLYS